MMADTAKRDSTAPVSDATDALPSTVVVLGLGITGLSCARYLSNQGRHVLVADSRQEPPGIEGLRIAAPDAELAVGSLDVDLPENTVQLVVSPGLPLDLRVVREARRRGIEVVGDIELFARAVRQPVAAITGSNGKSTVTTMIAEMAVRSGRQMPAGGNLGTPALDLLDMPAEGYLLELSSFQLELTDSLRPTVASVLNISADHIDRHGSMEAYRAAKARVLRNARTVVVNRHDPIVMDMAADREDAVSFGLDAPGGAEHYGVAELKGRRWLARGDETLMPADEIGVPGSHNVLNALAALAIGERMGLCGRPVLTALRAYRGLPHRTQLVAEIHGVRWVDDSKATNVGAAIAAIRGMESPLVLIAGGDGKGADFTPLAEALQGRARAVVLLGRDAPLLAKAIGNTVPWEVVDSMTAAVDAARRLAKSGDVVLLSPACASLDMYSSYAARGEAFRAAVMEDRR
jgi:UDP-N-acetylmuramoylalanine--D-glutamate ligase